MSLSPFCNENIGLKIEIGKSTEEWSTKPMTGEECKKVSVIDEHIPKRQAESDNKPKGSVNSRKWDYLKP